MFKRMADLNVWLVGGAYHHNSAELYTHQARLRKAFEEAVSKNSCGQLLDLTAKSLAVLWLRPKWVRNCNAALKA